MSALNTFTPEDCMALFEGLGLPVKVERGNRVFPASDKSSDVIKALKKLLDVNNVRILLNSRVSRVVKREDVFEVVHSGGSIVADKVVIATGGLSYPLTGSDGDGYKLARAFGHGVVKTYPSLVSLVVEEYYAGELQGLSLKNVNATARVNGKEMISDFGEMVFTHNGLSGPIILTVSAMIARLAGNDITVSVDLKPALSAEQLDDRIVRDFLDARNKNFSNSLEELLPHKLIPVIIRLSGIHSDTKVNQITKEQRSRLGWVIKNLTFTVKETGGYSEAVITSGGVNLKEINPKTMESKLVKGLYFVGEVLDADALTGGYNLQIAFSTGYACGKNILS
jgi:predicted Rossmann fold flavoprotein